jgi:hypothetical protein
MSQMSPGVTPQETPNQNQPTTTTSDDVKGSYQDRLNQLTRRASDAERVAASTNSENTELQAQVAQLTQQIASLTSRQPAVEQPASQPWDTPGKTPPKGQPFDVQGLTEAIKTVVQQEIAPLTTSIRERDENEQLVASQRQSFKQAAAVYPELANADSEFYKTFEQLWDARKDMHTVAGAPELLATAARGLLSDARRTEDVRRIAAAAHKPTAARAGDPVEGKDLAEAKQALGQLVQEGVTGEREWKDSDISDYLKLKVATELTRQE